MQRRTVRGQLSWHPALSIFVALSLLDLLSTWLAIQMGLPEGNLLPKLLLRSGGLAALVGFKAGIVLLVTWLMLRLGPHHPRLWSALRIGNWIMMLVVVLNVAQLLAA